ncbi:MAG: hypothetical protein HC906_05255 [Bacteroidales bacterium]|nr:hypothetical protein [Bacteroidales bacterium]
MKIIYIALVKQVNDEMKKCRIHKQLLPYYVAYTVIILLVMDHSFFWDKDVLIFKAGIFGFLKIILV